MVSRSSHALRSILLLAGSFTFAFLLGEMAHEYGHYLGHQAYGISDVQVQLDPFGASRIVGGTSPPMKVLSVTSGTGPMFNLVLGIVCFRLFWPIRRPVLLPLLLWGPIAMVQEGVTLSIGLLTPGGDAQWIAAAGIPLLVILFTGLILLAAGLVGIILLLPVAAVELDDPFGKNVIIVLAGMGSLITLRFIHAWLLSPDSIVENLIPLVFSILVAIIIVLAYAPLGRIFRDIAGMGIQPLTWTKVLMALLLGTGMFLFQFLGWK